MIAAGLAPHEPVAGPSARHLSTDELRQAIDSACDSVAPTWPLDRLVAVNPYWGRTSHDFVDVARAMAREAGSPLFMPPAYFAQAWSRGEITPGDLDQAACESRHGLDAASAPTSHELVQALDRMRVHCPQGPALPLLSDALDARRDLRHEPAWDDVLTHQISQFCASHFDTDQADWRPVVKEAGAGTVLGSGLYARWRDSLAHDRGVAWLMHAPHIAARAGRLPPSANQLLEEAVRLMQLPVGQAGLWMRVVLLRIKGWASWCAYRRWQARLDGRDDADLIDLLAIRAAWECLLDDGDRGPGSVWTAWRGEWDRGAQRAPHPALEVLSVWQRAQELAYRRALLAALQGAASGAKASQDAAAAAAPTPRAQAVFCIDVRSEVFRRALEAAAPDVQTLGFAGFFGLALRHQPLGVEDAEAARSLAPALMSPALVSTDSTGHATEDGGLALRRRRRLATSAPWSAFQRLPASGFTLVESVGGIYLGKLLGRSGVLGRWTEAGPPQAPGLSAAEARRLRPAMMPGAGVPADAQRVHQALGILRAMGLTQNFARLVLVAGHAAHSANNPQLAALQCGACGGHGGDVNARALALLLNDAAVRLGLAGQGLHIPSHTHFIAGVHNTTTDEVSLFDTDLLPPGHAADVQALRADLESAGRQARAWRAPRLGLPHLGDQPRALERALHERARDWAQTRAEWGLANNAAFIVAPRRRTRGAALDGRAFLHEYDAHADADGAVLAQILAGPLVVGHWINMQYYASTVDPQGFGSGNKLLHNVVGGRIGVFEGNGGDLRIGLAWQSVHDGERWMHAPLRLSVLIDAPRERIERVLAADATVRGLVERRWLHLLRFVDGDAAAVGLEAWQHGQWRTASPSADGRA